MPIVDVVPTVVAPLLDIRQNGSDSLSPAVANSPNFVQTFMVGHILQTKTFDPYLEVRIRKPRRKTGLREISQLTGVTVDSRATSSPVAIETLYGIIGHRPLPI